MKILKILFITFLIFFIVAAIALFIFLKTFDINRFKPQIIATASAALGRGVDFKNLTLQFSLHDGLTVNLKQLTIQGDPDFQTGDFLKIEEVALGVDVLNFLKTKQIAVSHVDVRSPQITFIHRGDGQIKVQDIGKPFNNPKSQTPQHPATQSTASSPPASSTNQTPTSLAQPPQNQPLASSSHNRNLPDIFINRIDVQNGTLLYIDQSFAPGASIPISHFSVNIQHFSLKDPFRFTAVAAVFSDEKNIQLEGNAQIILPENQVKLSAVKGTTDLSQFSLTKLRESLPGLKQTPFPETLAGKFQADIKNLVAGPQGLSSLSGNLNLSDGKISFKEIAPGIFFEAGQINLKMTDLSLTDPFPVNLQAAVLSDQPNIFVDGTCRVNLPNQIVQLKNTKISTDLSSISLSKLQASVSSLKGVQLPEQLAGKFNASMDSLELSPQGVSFFVIKGGWSQGSVKLKQLAIPLEDIRLQFQQSENKLSVDEFFAKLGRGQFAAKATVDDYSGKQNVTGQMNVDGVDLFEVVEQKDQPVKLAGLVFGKWSIQAQGLEPAKFQQSLSGGGEVDVKNGRLSDMNILKLVLSKISIVPGLAEKLEQSLPDRYKEKLTEKDTVLNKVHLVMTASNGSVTVNPAEIDADSFLLSSMGNVGFDQSYSFNGSLSIPADLSASMISVVPDLQYLLDEQQRILIPVKIKGKGSQINPPMPDLKYLGERIGKRELEKVLDKVFNKGEKNTPASNDSNPNSAPKEKRPEQQILENILDRIFK